MAPSYEILPEKRLVRVVYSEPATLQEWTATMNAIVRNEKFAPHFGFLIDRRAVPAPTASFTQGVVQWLEWHARGLGENHRSATVVPDRASYGMARMIQGFTGSQNIRVFTDVEEAEKWLRDAVESEVHRYRD